MIHVHKALPELFEVLSSGECRFELLEEADDRKAYAVGDYLAVNEVAGGKHDKEPAFTGNCRLFRISYILRDKARLAPGVIALGLQLAPLSFEDVMASKTPGIT